MHHSILLTDESIGRGGGEINFVDGVKWSPKKLKYQYTLANVNSDSK